MPSVVRDTAAIAGQLRLRDDWRAITAEGETSLDLRLLTRVNVLFALLRTREPYRAGYRAAETPAA